MGKKEIIEFVQQRLNNRESLDAVVIQSSFPDIYQDAESVFGSWKEAITSSKVGVEISDSVPWTRDRVINTIQVYDWNNFSLKFGYVNKHHPELRKKAEQFFGSWGDAVNAAGLDYEDIKKNKIGGKTYLAEDGVLYSSETTGLVADELYKLKNDEIIVGYKHNRPIIYNSNLITDFVIELSNGASLLMEVDVLTNKDDLDERLKYYKKANLLNCKVSSAHNIKNIIERYSNWFSLPDVNCLITTHKNPDGDAISSCVALYNYYKENGKEVYLKLSGKVPKNLVWMLENVDVVKKIPDNIDMVFVLDCAPLKSRIGWELPVLPIYNIDHHKMRIKDNDPDNYIHVVDSCSTASILASRFGIKDNVLAVGLYTDTTFTKKTQEVFHALNLIDIDEQTLETYISLVNSNSDKKIWAALQEAKTHKCRNGFIIVELKEDYDVAIIEDFMQILMKLHESICLIYGDDLDVKLRSSNQNLDLSEIAKQYGGGGHPYASVCNIDGKLSEFKNKIKALEVPKQETQKDE